MPCLAASLGSAPDRRKLRWEWERLLVHAKMPWGTTALCPWPAVPLSCGLPQNLSSAESQPEVPPGHGLSRALLSLMMTEHMGQGQRFVLCPSLSQQVQTDWHLLALPPPCCSVCSRLPFLDICCWFWLPSSSSYNNREPENPASKVQLPGLSRITYVGALPLPPGPRRDLHFLSPGAFPPLPGVLVGTHTASPLRQKSALPWQGLPFSEG